MGKGGKKEVISVFENGYMLVKENNRCGVIDEKGNVIIKSKYDKIIKHSNFFIALKKEKYRLKDMYGKNVTKLEYDEIKDTNSYLFIVRIDDFYGLIDFEGNEVLKVCYKSIKPIYYDCADYFIVTNKEGKCGLIDKNGKTLLKCKYYAIYRLHHDKFSVLNSEAYAIYSIYNGFVFDFKITAIQTFLSHSSNLICTINGKYGIIDLDGNVITDFKYDAMYLCSRYADDVSAKIGDRYCLINSSGRKVTSVKYDYIKYLDVEKGLLIVREWAKFGVINNKGEEILSSSYDALRMIDSTHLITRISNFYSLYKISGEALINYFKKEKFKEICKENGIKYDQKIIDLLN